MTQILEIVHSQHEMVKELFQKLEEAQSSAEKERIYTRIKESLVPHIKGEEKYFYAVLEEKEEFKEDVLHGIEEHHAAKLFIKEIEGMSSSGDHWKAKVAVLGDIIEHHIESEESKIFKAARESLSQEEMEKIGEDFENVTGKRKQSRLTRVS